MDVISWWLSRASSPLRSNFGSSFLKAFPLSYLRHSNSPFDCSEVRPLMRHHLPSFQQSTSLQLIITFSHQHIHTYLTRDSSPHPHHHSFTVQASPISIESFQGWSPFTRTQVEGRFGAEGAGTIRLWTVGSGSLARSSDGQTTRLELGLVVQRSVRELDSDYRVRVCSGL